MRVPRRSSVMDRLERATRPRPPAVVATPLAASSGVPGEDGRTILNGSGAPAEGTGTNGDFYIDTSAWAIYGPKSSGKWGPGTPILGEDGTDGAGLPEGVTDYGLVTELPKSPVKGDRCHYSYKGLVWHCIADGDPEKTGFAWAVEGTAELHAGSAELETLTNKTAYASLAKPLSIVLPAVEGIWDIRNEAMIDTDASSESRTGFHSHTIGATAASDNWAVRLTTEGTNAGGDSSGSVTERHTVKEKSAKVEEKCRTVGNYAIDWSSRHLWARPVRLG